MSRGRREQQARAAHSAKRICRVAIQMTVDADGNPSLAFNAPGVTLDELHLMLRSGLVAVETEQAKVKQRIQVFGGLPKEMTKGLL